MWLSITLSDNSSFIYTELWPLFDFYETLFSGFLFYIY